MRKKDLSSLAKFKYDVSFAISKAKKPLVWIEAFDYSYVLDVVCSLNYAGWIWCESSGIVNDLQTKATFTVNNQELQTETLSESIKNILHLPSFKLLLARVSSPLFTTDRKLISSLQDFVFENNNKGNDDKQTIVLISNTHISGLELEHICERLEMPLPDKDDIHNELDIVFDKDSEGNPIFKYEYAADFRMGGKTKDNKKDLIDALYGMSLYDIRELLRTLMAESPNGKIKLDLNGQRLPERVIARKKQLVRNSGLLEVIDLKNKSTYHENIGGIDGLREFLKEQKKKISPVFLRSKLPKPKGILLVGAPGCGKSESAKAAASILELPLFRLNIGDLLGHKYGQSENRFNEALRTADASAPCVLWIDEIEKAFAGAGNEQENDDTMTHIIGRFLTWMQEHETLVYLVATANDLSKMRPELLRKGRWDEIFYLSYPDENGIKEIIDKKSKEYDIYLDAAIPDKLMSLMKGMSGAEIVSILEEAANKEFPYDSNDDNTKIKISVPIDTFKNCVERIAELKKQDEKKNLDTKVDEEILELKLRYLDNFDKNKEEIARKLLMEKYLRDDKNNYESKGYRPANKISK